MISSKAAVSARSHVGPEAIPALQGILVSGSPRVGF